jgi:hypothetical protein
MHAVLWYFLGKSNKTSGGTKMFLRYTADAGFQTGIGEDWVFVSLKFKNYKSHDMNYSGNG